MCFCDCHTPGIFGSITCCQHPQWVRVGRHSSAAQHWIPTELCAEPLLYNLMNPDDTTVSRTTTWSLTDHEERVRTSCFCKFTSGRNDPGSKHGLGKDITAETFLRVLRKIPIPWLHTLVYCLCVVLLLHRKRSSTGLLDGFSQLWRTYIVPAASKRLISSSWLLWTVLMFELLPSGRQNRTIKTRTNRLENSFYCRAVSLVSADMNELCALRSCAAWENVERLL